MKKICNKKIRNYAKERGILLWEIAARLGISDANFSRKLRTEFSEEEINKIEKIIDELSEE